MFSPPACGSFSISITSPGATRYCFPPARMTAYMAMPPMVRRIGLSPSRDGALGPAHADPNFLRLQVPSRKALFSRAEWPAIFPEDPAATPGDRETAGRPEPRVEGALMGCCYGQTIEV